MRTVLPCGTAACRADDLVSYSSVCCLFEKLLNKLRGQLGYAHGAAGPGLSSGSSIFPSSTFSVVMRGVVTKHRMRPARPSLPIKLPVTSTRLKGTCSIMIDAAMIRAPLSLSFYIVENEGCEHVVIGKIF